MAYLILAIKKEPTMNAITTKFIAKIKQKSGRMVRVGERERGGGV